MTSFSDLLVLLAFWLSVTGIAVASPVLAKKTDSNTFSVSLAHNADAAPHGPTEYLKTLKKFNIEIPQELQNIVDHHQAKTSAKAAQGGETSIPAGAKDGDQLWLAPISIGTPPQELFLDLDTGSADTWVLSTDTKKSMVNGQTIYDHASSSSAVLTKGCSWSIEYGDGSGSEGICYKDTFTMGNLSIPGMTIESATILSQFKIMPSMSGLVGLGWPSIIQTTPLQKALLDFLAEVLDKPIFTVDFRHNSSEGSFNFGYIDHTLHGSEEIKYINVNTTLGYWTVLNTGFGVAGDASEYTFQAPKQVLVDTGSTLLYAPQGAVATYYSKIPGARYSSEDYGYVVPCNSSNIPDFLWTLADDEGNKITGSVPGAYVPFVHVSDELCYAGIQTLGALSGSSGIDGIFGDIFLKSAFAVFDIENKKIGLAPKPLDTGNGAL